MPGSPTATPASRFLILGYTIGFEVSSTRISVNEQRVQDAATRQQLHEFFRPFPPPPTGERSAPVRSTPMGAFLCADSHRVRYRLAPDL